MKKPSLIFLSILLHASAYGMQSPETSRPSDQNGAASHSVSEASVHNTEQTEAEKNSMAEEVCVFLNERKGHIERRIESVYGCLSILCYLEHLKDERKIRTLYTICSANSHYKKGREFVQKLARDLNYYGIRIISRSLIPEDEIGNIHNHWEIINTRLDKSDAILLLVKGDLPNSLQHDPMLSHEVFDIKGRVRQLAYLKIASLDALDGAESNQMKKSIRKVLKSDIKLYQAAKLRYELIKDLANYDENKLDQLWNHIDDAIEAEPEDELQFSKSINKVPAWASRIISVICFYNRLKDQLGSLHMQISVEHYNAREKQANAILDIFNKHEIEEGTTTQEAIDQEHEARRKEYFENRDKALSPNWFESEDGGKFFIDLLGQVDALYEKLQKEYSILE